ncbi:hypothetical protein H7K32_11605 [Brevibacillus agri]|uniref:hypothetical protein n=1 Tax=Brevibacillus agri TaxID=51101 RepID=UPI001C8DD2EC|nr:hypothetical protein [Brevibacillus agri]MBY0052318.1 hypothetical protein [Brevibacillus agri]
MERVGRVIERVQELRDRLERLERQTGDHHQTTGHILRAFANFYEDELDDLISDVKWIEQQLESFVEDSEENE